MLKSLSSHQRKIIGLSLLVLTCMLFYQFFQIDLKHFDFAMQIRFPKLLVMAITAFCIGSATIVFQSIIQNQIVTPCLLGMNSMYILIHTLVVFVLGAGNSLVSNKLLFFGLDLFLMAIGAVFIYGYLFKKAKGNVLYILLIGTVMATLFSSMTSSLQRIMDPNEFLTLQNALIASFHRANTSMISFSLIAVVAVIGLTWKDLKMLDVIALGKEQAINLGVDYDRVIRRLLIGVTLFIAIATALVGPISFLGLVIANLSRQLFKTYRHLYLILGSCLLGMIALIGGQTLIEHYFNFSTNIGVFINIGGGLYFLALIMKERKT